MEQEYTINYNVYNQIKSEIERKSTGVEIHNNAHLLSRLLNNLQRFVKYKNKWFNETDEITKIKNVIKKVLVELGYEYYNIEWFINEQI